MIGRCAALQSCGRWLIQFDPPHCSILGVQNVAREETGFHGIVKAGAEAERFHRSKRLSRSRSRAAPSTLGVVGRFILRRAFSTCC